MTDIPLPALSWLPEREAARRAAGLRRELRHRSAAEAGLLDLAGNDYLALAHDPRVTSAAAEAALEWGAGSTGSRLVTGSTTLHAELESALASHVGAEAGLVFSSGYLANLGAITALAGRGDVIVSDELNHASIIDACRLSRARVEITPHGDFEAVRKALSARDERRALVVVDAVFSVDGDLAPLAELADAVREYEALLVVDEAHGVGVVGASGRGAVHAAGIAGRPDVVVTATLSKALGSQGGAVLGGADVVGHLVDSARSFIFDTGLAPACAAAALAALRIVQEEPWRPELTRRHALAIAQMARGLGYVATEPAAAVTAVKIGSPQQAVAVAERCLAAGVRVGCFRPPSTPDEICRLRVAARPDLTAADLDRLESALGGAPR